MYTSTPIFHQGLTAQEMLDYCKQSTMENTRQPAIETDSTGKEYVVDYGISIFSDIASGIPERDDPYALSRALPVDGEWLLDEHYGVVNPLRPRHIESQLCEKYLKRKFDGFPYKVYYHCGYWHDELQAFVVTLPYEARQILLMHCPGEKLENFHGVSEFEMINAENNLNHMQLLCALQQSYAEQTLNNVTAHQHYLDQIPPIREEVDRLATVIDQQKNGIMDRDHW